MPIAYKCRDCGYQAIKRWRGPCPGAHCYDDILTVHCDDPNAEQAEIADGEVVPLRDAVAQVIEVPRIETGIGAIDAMLGDGFAHNGVYLLTGDPGSGKTTLLLQLLRGIAILRRDVLFVTGEQTVNDIALSAKRFGEFPSRLMAVRETDLNRILDIVVERKPKLVVIDSAQTLAVKSAIGTELEIGSSMSIKVSIRTIMEFAKEQGVCVIVIGHVTKDGAISGPRALEHYVDCVMHLATRGTKREFRVPYKNRFTKLPLPQKVTMAMTDVGLEVTKEKNEDDEPPPPPALPARPKKPTFLKAVP